MRRYLPIENVRVRVHPDDTAFDILTRVIAAYVAGCVVTVSAPPDINSSTIFLLKRLK